jgi:hypothetical protein
VNNIRICIVALSSLLLQACVQTPQTAEEFRKVVPGAMMTKTDTYQVNRPMSDVASTFERLAPKCLNVTVQTVSHSTTSFQNLVARYKATVVRTSERVELHVQQLYETGVLYPSKPPEGGVYLWSRMRTRNPTRAHVFSCTVRQWDTTRSIAPSAVGPLERISAAPT